MKLQPQMHKTWSKHLSPNAMGATAVSVLMAGGLAAALSITANAAEDPLSHASPVPADESLIPDLPEFPWEWRPIEALLELHQAPPLGPDDKGGTYTDMGQADHSYLTEREKALLALSRAAVEASRLAGTLGVPSIGSHGIPANPVEAERFKLEAQARARTSTPVAGTGAPSDHVHLVDGVTPSAGPVALTDAEFEKLAAVLGQTGVVVLPPSTVPIQEDARAPRHLELLNAPTKNDQSSAEDR